MHYSSVQDQVAVLAWNEDTVHTYQFTSFTDGSFTYTIPSATARVKVYHGRSNERADTIFLQYQGTAPGNDQAAYLVKEVSGNYLIQYFPGTEERIFLRRLVRNRHGHFQ